MTHQDEPPLTRRQLRERERREEAEHAARHRDLPAHSDSPAEPHETESAPRGDGTDSVVELDERHLRAPLEPAPFPSASESAGDLTGSAFGITSENSHTSHAEGAPAGEAFDQIVSRSGGAPSTGATNALILPDPQTLDATGPLLSTGEVLVTGSIDLPRLLSSTGAASKLYDSSELDRTDDDPDIPVTADIAPVRASRAVSSHTSTPGIMAPPRSRGSRLPIVLAITAGVLLVAVVTLVVTGFVLGII